MYKVLGTVFLVLISSHFFISCKSTGSKNSTPPFNQVPQNIVDPDKDSTRQIASDLHDTLSDYSAQSNKPVELPTVDELTTAIDTQAADAAAAALAFQLGGGICENGQTTNCIPAERPAVTTDPKNISQGHMWTYLLIGVPAAAATVTLAIGAYAANQYRLLKGARAKLDKLEPKIGTLPGVKAAVVAEAQASASRTPRVEPAAGSDRSVSPSVLITPTSSERSLSEKTQSASSTDSPEKEAKPTELGTDRKAFDSHQKSFTKSTKFLAASGLTTAILGVGAAVIASKMGLAEEQAQLTAFQQRLSDLETRWLAVYGRKVAGQQ